MLSIESLYIHTLEVSRPTRTGDGQGGWSVAYADVGAIPGRLRPASSSERTVALQEQAKITHVLYCGTDSNVRRGDLVSGAGPIVEVIAVREPSHMGHHLEVDCAEIQKEGGEEPSS